MQARRQGQPRRDLQHLSRSAAARVTARAAILHGMPRYADLIADALRCVREIMPWDLAERLAQAPPPLVLDVREPAEFAQALAARVRPDQLRPR